MASTTAAGKPWRRLAGGFDGGEDPGDVVPGWVAEIVARGRRPAKPEDKFAFVLQPAPVRGALCLHLCAHSLTSDAGRQPGRCCWVACSWTPQLDWHSGPGRL